jgi:hypothetical protein
LGGWEFWKNFYNFSLSLSNACSIPVVNFYPTLKLYIFKFVPWPLTPPDLKIYFPTPILGYYDRHQKNFTNCEILCTLEILRLFSTRVDETRTAIVRITMVTCICVFWRTLSFFRVGLDTDARTTPSYQTSDDQNPCSKGQQVASTRQLCQISTALLTLSAIQGLIRDATGRSDC